MIDCVWRGDPPDRPWVPGDVFWFGYDLSKHYRRHVRPERKPISVVVPTRGGGATAFCIDSHPTGRPDEAWHVTIVGELVEGERPDITVKPSIHCVGLWHGWLTNGVLSDDAG